MKKILKNSSQIVMSDLACEFVSSKKRINNQIVKVFDVVLDDEDAKRIGKRAGKYVTVDTNAIINCEIENFDRVSSVLKDEIKSFIVGENILVVGLGNYKLAADSLGTKVVDLVQPTRNIFSAKYKVSTISPGVVGSTGLESYEVVKGICDTIKPDTVIVVDSLCANSLSRLLTTFQITDTGITPGSGVNNHRISFNRESMNTFVVSIGVPTVVYASTIVKEYEGKLFNGDLVVSPKDIDFAIKDCAKIIASALNSIFIE